MKNQSEIGSTVCRRDDSGTGNSFYHAGIKTVDFRLFHQDADSNDRFQYPKLRIPRHMTPLHDDVFFEIDSARKLVAEFKHRSSGRADVAQDSAVDQDDPVIKAQREEEAGLIARAKERAERRESDRAEARAHASETAYARLEAREILRELAEARAEELAAAEESLRKASEKQEATAGADPGRHGAAPADPVRYMWFPGLGASHVWYFTSESERRGPVTFKDLRTMAASRVLDPRLDMVWKKGMQEWQQAGLVDGLFERSAIQEEVVTKPLPSQAPLKSLRSSALMEKLASKDLHWPGIGRLGILFGVLLFPVIWNLILSFVSPFMVSKFGVELMETLHPMLAIVPPLVLACLFLSRLANVGMNRWWSLAVVVPFLNLWLAFRCLFCPAGYAYHRRIDWQGVAMIAAVCLIAPFTWNTMLKHPVMTYGAYLQAGVRTAVDQVVGIVGPRF